MTRAARSGSPRHAVAGIAMVASVLALGVWTEPASCAPEPYMTVAYQGELLDGGVPVTTLVKFRFAFIDDSGGQVLWTNDGLFPPDDAVTLTVDQGVFSVRLGDAALPGMDAIPTDIFDNTSRPVLRVWAQVDGDDLEFPDQPVSGVPFAHISNAALRSHGTFSADGQIWSKQDGFKFPDGTVQTTALSGGGGGTLDDSYDSGGAGAGRTITADAGPVELVAPGEEALRIRGDIELHDASGNPQIQIDESGILQVGYSEDPGAAGELRVYGGELYPGILLDGVNRIVYTDQVKSIFTSSITLDQELRVRGNGGDTVVGLEPDGDIKVGAVDGSNAGSLFIYGQSSTPTIEMNGLSGRVSCTKLTITGGADLAEPFDVTGGTPLAPGTVVVIDTANPGALTISRHAYDRRVAGVISGAGGIEAGLTLTQEGRMSAGQNVALTGRVYVRADASSAPILPGDLLTTSDRPGHAMRVSDTGRAHGAVLGKAMSTLDDGTGLVLALVNLQ